MKVAALVSGGVDSSTVLALLKEQGHDVTAFYLKIWLEEELAHLSDCPWEEDLNYVRQVCGQLNVPLEIINLQKEYWERVVSYVLEEVKAGRTPNPDMMCNARVKFEAFFEAIDASYEKVATGHYAATEEKDGKTWLLRVNDPVKDQTYFLAGLSQEKISRALFPVGKMLKSEVRGRAQKFNLPNKDRKDSQGICFLGKIKYNEFVKHYLGEKRGKFINADTDEIIGEHDGYWFYTIGQRKGISLDKGHDGPWYVVSKDVAKNIVFVSNEYGKHKAGKKSFIVKDVNWIAERPQTNNLLVKVRHGETFYPCKIAEKEDKTLNVSIEGEDQGIAPGQFAVFYDGKYCYGGGVVGAEIPHHKH